MSVFGYQILFFGRLRGVNQSEPVFLEGVVD